MTDKAVEICSSSAEFDLGMLEHTFAKTRGRNSKVRKPARTPAGVRLRWENQLDKCVLDTDVINALPAADQVACVRSVYLILHRLLDVISTAEDHEELRMSTADIGSFNQALRDVVLRTRELSLRAKVVNKLTKKMRVKLCGVMALSPRLQEALKTYVSLSTCRARSHINGVLSCVVLTRGDGFPIFPSSLSLSSDV